MEQASMGMSRNGGKPHATVSLRSPRAAARRCLLASLMLVSLVLACLAAPVHVRAAQVAQPLPLPLVEPPVAGVEAPLQVLAGLPVASSIESVSMLPPGSFQSFDPTRLYRLGPDTALWLRLQISVDAPMDGSRWLLEFPTAIVDRYDVFQRNGDGQWMQMEAGDRVAHRKWPLDSLRPRFPLMAPTAGVHDVYVRVVHQVPLSLRPLIVNAAQASEHDSNQMLWTGLLLGVIATLVFTCLQMSLSFHDRTYVWYAGYLVCTAFAALSYTGIAQRDLWPDATKFSSDFVVFSIMGAYAFNLQFARSMFGSTQGPVWRMAARVLVGLCVGYALLTEFRDDYGRHIVGFFVISLAVFAYIIAMAVQTWRRGVVFAGYWLLVYVPYLLSIGLTLFANVGLVPAMWLPGEIPVLGALAEAVAMMWCINAYGRLRHAQAVREQAAALRDPLTGFLRLKVFRERADRLWTRAARSRGDVAVVYVRVEPAHPQGQSAVEYEALMARSVRLVRTATRELDTVGRLGHNLLGILMPGMPPGEGLNSRMARLVALGLMQDLHDPTALELRFQLAVGQRRDFPGSFMELDTALMALLLRREQDKRAIRYLDVVVPTRRMQGGVGIDAQSSARAPTGPASGRR